LKRVGRNPLAGDSQGIVEKLEKADSSRVVADPEKLAKLLEAED